MDLPSRQIVTVQMLIHGPADGVRISHPAMPGRYTHGIVIFPAGDSINGFWIGAFNSSQEDALTTDTDQFMEYNSHWSGAWELLDQEGKWTKSFPDGTYIQSSDVTDKPTTYVHTVDAQQNQQLTEFTESQRVPSPPLPRHLYIHHAAGTDQDIDPSGNVVMNGAPGASLTLNFNGGTVTIDAHGSITAAAASGQQVELTANGGFLQINQSGAINGNAAPGQHMNFSAGGSATSFTLVRSDLLSQWLAGHTHTNGNGGGNTGTPVQSIEPSTVQSTMANVSE